MKEEMMPSPCGQSQKRKVRLTIGEMYIELKDSKTDAGNRKVLSILGRELKRVESGESVLTFQEIADSLGYADRRNVQNFHREFRESGEEMQPFLSRKSSKKDQSFGKIEQQILASPFLPLHKQYLAFIEGHPEASLSEPTFRKYVNEIDGSTILKRMQHLVGKEGSSIDSKRYVKELLSLAEFTAAKKKEIVEVFAEVKDERPAKIRPRALELSSPVGQKKLLVVFLYVCNVSQEMLSLLCGVSKTSLHYWICAVCTEDLDWQILTAIVCWSGQVSVDEKWRWIDESWHFALCAVDSVTGFPLLIELYPTLDSVNWTLFFRHFRALYGIPKLITSDGSQSLAAARELVFQGVRYQLCTFHKLRNLMKRLRQHIRDPKLFRRSVRLAKHIFSKTSVSSRKHAAKTLQTLVGKQVSSYIDEHILRYWRRLTMSLTNNASERFNRKIEKCFSGRYGIQSTESANVLLRGLWLKELLLNGRQHLEATSQFKTIDWSAVCQENLDTSKILHFFHDNEPSHVEKAA
jgi:transposase-like protein